MSPEERRSVILYAAPPGVEPRLPSEREPGGQLELNPVERG